MLIVKHRAWFFGLSLLLVLGSVVALTNFGLRFSTDFTGGTILEVEYTGTAPAITAVREAVDALKLADVSVQTTGEQSYLLRLQTITDAEHQALLKSLGGLASPGEKIVEKRFSAVGPVLGRELARKGLIAITLVIVLILIYVAFVFHKVSRPVSSWVYGLVSIVMMAHDVFVPIGVFAFLGHYYGVEVDALSLTALLTILGLSVNDKIVALDRIRENLLRRSHSETFAETVGRSLSETLSRSINTSLTVILVLLAIVFFGSTSTRYFAFAMAVGMIVATYSSIFVAAPLLVSWEKWRANQSK